MDSKEAVVVGVDGTDTALRAVEWAAGEAALREVPLQVVHVMPSAALPDGRRHAADLLARAYTVAHRHVPAVRANTELRVGDPTTELLDAAADADLLVVGIIGERIGAIVLGSVALRLAGTASCPVTVVRGEARPATAPVAVGVEDVSSDAAAIDLAFADAHRHHSGVVVVHARHLPERERAQAASALLSDLQPWRSHCPDVDVDVSVVPGRPDGELLHAAFTSRMIVVASHGRGAAARALLGSTSKALVRYSRCPVTVVRRGAPPATGVDAGVVGGVDDGSRR